MDIENLDHLGLVAAVIDELGLVELGDAELGTHCLQQVSPGHVLKAMILNGLGFVSAPLYLFSEFFAGKPVEHLLGRGIRAEHLNDDRPGRVLDKLFTYGTMQFFLSQQRRQSDEGWKASVEKQEKALQRQLKELCRQIFACKPDAMEALLRFQDILENHTLTQVRLVPIPAKRAPGRPKKRGTSTHEPVQGYQLQATLERKPEFEKTQRHSRFILATNVLDAEAYPAQRLLQEYKQQQHVERGFRFLKDLLFFTSSVFVKKPQRVEALALIMALTLLVYTLGQRKLRQQLALANQTLLDQKQKPTNNPTLRWVLQKFQAIHLVTLNGTQQVGNLTDERCTIIRLFGLPCCSYYLLI